MGFEFLVDILFFVLDIDVESVVSEYVNVDSGIVDIKVVLEGVCYILMECFVEDVMLLVKVCKYLIENVYVKSMVVLGKE